MEDDNNSKMQQPNWLLLGLCLLSCCFLKCLVVLWECQLHMVSCKQIVGFMLLSHCSLISFFYFYFNSHTLHILHHRTIICCVTCSNRIALVPVVGCEVSYLCTVPIEDDDDICQTGKVTECCRILGIINTKVDDDKWRINFGRLGGIRVLRLTVFTVKKPPNFNPDPPEEQTQSLSDSSSETAVPPDDDVAQPPSKKQNFAYVAGKQVEVMPPSNHTPNYHSHDQSGVTPPCAANRWGLGALPRQQTLTQMFEETPDSFNFDRTKNTKTSNWTAGFK